MQTKLLREIKIALPNLRKSEVKVAEYISATFLKL